MRKMRRNSIDVEVKRRASRGGNKNQVPSASERRSLKCWMLAEFGDGISAPCAFCGKPLLYSTLTKDRFPKPGRKGGRYKRGNVRPACMSCNSSEGAKSAAIERALLRAQRDLRNEKRRLAYAYSKKFSAWMYHPHDLHELVDNLSPLQFSTGLSTCE